MDSPFLYKMKLHTPLFRAKTVAKEGRWYALSVEDAYSYGTHITEYSTIKELRLINIMSITFHNDFMDRLMLLYPGEGYKGIDINKLKCLIPLGLIDINTQRIACNMLRFDAPINESSWNSELQWNVDMIHNRHRFSEHSLDTHLVSVLEQIYGDIYDGYISPIKWATKIHGNYFPREVCCFRLGNTKEEREHLRPNVGMLGGAYPLHPIAIPKTLRLSDTLVKSLESNENKQGLHLFWNPHTEDRDSTKNNKRRRNKTVKKRNSNNREIL